MVQTVLEHFRFIISCVLAFRWWKFSFMFWLILSAYVSWDAEVMYGAGAFDIFLDVPLLRVHNFYTGEKRAGQTSTALLQPFCICYISPSHEVFGFNEQDSHWLHFAGKLVLFCFGQCKDRLRMQRTDVTWLACTKNRILPGCFLWGLSRLTDVKERLSGAAFARGLSACSQAVIVKH